MTAPRFVDIPEKLKRDVQQHPDPAAAAWLGSLPETLRACCRRWGLRIDRVYPRTTLNFVARARREDGTGVVLKVRCPIGEEVWGEVRTLRICAGQGMARLLDWDPDHHAMLLEQLRPGLTLMTVRDDDRATRIGLEVLRRIWQHPADETIGLTVEQWARGSFEQYCRRWAGQTTPLPGDLVERARRTLTGPAEQCVLLHGDAHHENILDAGQDRWAAIDPKGVCGPRLYDAATFLKSMPLSWPGGLDDPAGLLRRRFDLAAEQLETPVQTLRRWALAQTVLSTVWMLEDHVGQAWREGLRLAERIESLD